MSKSDNQKKKQIDNAEPVSRDQMQKISKFINEAVGGEEKDICPVCGDHRNTVLDKAFAVPLAQLEGLVGIGPNAPAYGTACVNCGYLRFFSKAVVDAKIDGLSSPFDSEVES